jgi:hypothetical protein
MKRSKAQGDVNVIGFDSETLQGPPITFQFFSPHFKRITGCTFIGKRSPMKVFLEQLGKLPSGNYRMYGHHLEFDMLSVLWDRRADIRDGNINMMVGNWKIEGRYSKPIFAVFSDGARRIELVDSMLWFMTSLEKAGKLVCPHLPKLIRPAGLGTTMYKPSDKRFVEYAMRDAEVAYFLGEAVEKFHRELDIPSQISLASMAATVFRLHYMRNNIYQPPLYEWMVGAAAAYHGGVNRVRTGCAPAWHRNVTAKDFSSAYPDAMSRFPPFDNPNGYKAYKSKTAARIKRVETYGVYKISGKAASCDWPALFNHDFEPLSGKFKNVWTTGVELNEALRMGELALASISGYHYVDDSFSYSPFYAYVMDFYRKKSETHIDPVMRYMYKILLNALTGKFIQTSPDHTLVDGKLVKINRAGGLYHPFIAGLITGDCRAKVHGAEHEYNAIHTATDGIFVPGIYKDTTKKELGALVNEGTGDLALFRNKLYIFYTDTETEDTYPSQVFAGKHVLKCARHGFQGTVGALEGMLVSTDRSYRVNKPIKLKTALRGGDTPNKFVISTRHIRNLNSAFEVYTYEKASKRQGRRAAS